MKLYLFLRRRNGQHLDNLVCHVIKVNWLGGRLTILIKLRKTNNIVDKRYKSCCFLADVAYKSCSIFGLHKTVFKQFCASNNGLKRSFQFVWNIGGELLAVTLGKRCFSHVKTKNNNAYRLAVRLGAINDELILASVSFLTKLGSLAVKCLFDGTAHIDTTVKDEKITTDRCFICRKQLFSGCIDTEHHTFFIKQNKSLVHWSGYLLEFIGLLT